MRKLIIFVLIFQINLSFSQNLYNLLEELYRKLSEEDLGSNYLQNTSQIDPLKLKWLEIGGVSNVHLKFYQIAVKQYNYDEKKVLHFLYQKLPPFCHLRERETQIICDPLSKYQNWDGTCNNLKRKTWGATFTPMKRIFPPSYEDGVNKPRGGIFRDGSARLTNSRVISTAFHYYNGKSDDDNYKYKSQISNLVPTFGQFLDHDITNTPEASKKCCTFEAKYPDCWPIEIYPKDYFYNNISTYQKCLDFTRSTPNCFPNLEFSGDEINPGQIVREQMNVISAYFDASHIYGSDPTTARRLRSFKGGEFLQSSKNPGLLPEVDEIRQHHGPNQPDFVIDHKGVFYAGESRSNLAPGLTVFHHLFFKEHNRLCYEIQIRRPDWNDDKIYLEARRILTAIWQNIVYNEYLPVILGRDSTSILDNGTRYDPNLEPSILNAFATAAYRFGHSMINGHVLLRRGYHLISDTKLSLQYFNSDLVLKNAGEGYELILEGFFAQKAYPVDTHLTEELTNFLFREKGADFGSDLFARNIQRGRDHGLPPYYFYREFCGLPPLIDDWTNKPQNIPEHTWDKLRALYSSPYEIDLFTGGVAEEILPGAGVTGSTFNCIKTIQFYNLKYGDRFFYTHEGEAGSFTREQILEIEKMGLRKLICLNSNNIFGVPKNPFSVFSDNNPSIDCKDEIKNPINLNVFL